MSDIRVAFVMATWHDDLVDRTKLGFFERMAELGHGEEAMDSVARAAVSKDHSRTTVVLGRKPVS